MAFADRARIIIKSGKGGDGHVSFRREKYVPNGGPDGGDGGKGGDVIFEVDKGINTLSDFRHRRKFEAEPGAEGGKKNMHGKNGQDLVLKVPEGTVVTEVTTGKVVCDMSGDNKRVVVLHGGKGGLGNMHFATPTMQAPKYAKPGGDSIELEVQLELKVIADVGLVGFPNVGKSTFLSRVTNADPKIANYHFTTLSPNLGVVDLDGANGFVIADIPGLIEGASEGIGLGHEFLRHIERTKVLLHIVDAASVEGRDPVMDIKSINQELEKYDANILKKPMIIAANKLDVCPDREEEILNDLRKAFPDTNIKIFGISAVSGKGVKELLYALSDELKNFTDEPTVYETEFDAEMLNPETQDITIEVDKDGTYVVEGEKIAKMLGYTNLESEKGFLFFQNFLKTQGILEKLENMGIEEGDIVSIYGLTFEYFK
ncbi:MAG: GTPase ObgE [Lachnospiraceae bacterium]|nr:GTPase ObgE [Lachnospiraceae bacterium]